MLRVGIIGYGGFGRFLHRAWETGGAARIAAVADERQPELPPNVQYSSDWTELLRSDQIDLVAVATPPVTHAEMACRAMQAGKHVLIEKPLALTEEEARRVIAVRDATGKVAGVDFMLRFNPLVEWIAQQCAGKTFGELKRIAVENFAQDESLPADHWFWNPAVSGGILVEHAVHFIDLANQWTGSPPLSVNGLKARRDDGRMDRMFTAVHHESGAIATHFHAFYRPNFFEKTTIHLAFDLADIRLDGWIPLSGNIDALVASATETAVRTLPGFEEMSYHEISHQLRDGILRSGGHDYAVQSRLAGSFRLAAPKEEVYASCLCSLLFDLEASIRHSAVRQRVTLEDGLESLRIALRGTGDCS